MGLLRMSLQAQRDRRIPEVWKTQMWVVATQIGDHKDFDVITISQF